MPAAFVSILLVIFGWLSFVNYTRTIEDSVEARQVNVAGHLRLYGSYIAAYASNNPGTTGTVSDAAAGIPNWFRKYPGMGNTAQSGRAYVFLSGLSNAESFAVAKRCGGGLKCGVTRGGQLFIPGESAAALTGLPAAVPANDALLIVL